MRSIPMPIALTRRAARAVVIAAALATVTVAGAATASATVRPDANTFNCTGSSPELCVGIDYSGTLVYDETAQVNLGFHSDNVLYEFGGPHIQGSAGPYAGGPGWVRQGSISIVEPFNHGDVFCADARVNGSVVATACVRLP